MSEINAEALRNRVEAAMRMLLDSGDMTPMAKRVILTALDAEGVTSDEQAGDA